MIRQQDFIPQIIRGVLVDIGRCIIAGTAIGRAFIKRQKIRVFPGQLRRHIDFILADGKMHNCAAFKA